MIHLSLYIYLYVHSTRAGSKLSEAIAKLALEQGWGSAEIDEAINGLQVNSLTALYLFGYSIQVPYYQYETSLHHPSSNLKLLF